MNGPIVCGVDGSPASAEAVRVASELARALGTTLVLVNAVPGTALPGASASPGAAERLRDEEVREGRELLAEAASRAGLGEDVEQRVVVGKPEDALVRLAEELEASLVVIGRRGHHRVRAAVLGSVSSSLAGRCPRPVVVVPPPE